VTGFPARTSGATGINEECRDISSWTELVRVYRQFQSSGEKVETDAPISIATPNSRPVAAACVAPHGAAVPVCRLREVFGLSGFETDILLLCVGAAIDRRFTPALATLQPEMPAPTFGLALSVLEQPHWTALSRMRPLRYWRLIEIGPGPLLQAPLTIDERILQCLLGIPTVDDRLALVIHELAGDDEEVEGARPPLRATAARGALHWRRAAQGTILLTGNRSSERATLFAAMCRQAGLKA
jgi:hypothetical protein